MDHSEYSKSTEEVIHVKNQDKRVQLVSLNIVI
jgi:hypothetical protein